ncbi:MAG: hypothetical protein ACYC21_13220 [Eubacteriales bacterium]
MRERFIFTFLFHMFGLSLLLIPNQYQGPVVTVISSIPLRVLDTVGVIMIFAGSIFLYTSLILCLRSQIKQTKQLPSNNSAEKTE